MATNVYDTVTLELQDGTELELRPLPIKQMKKFMKELSNLGNAPEPAEGEEEKTGIDQIVDLTIICLEKNKGAKDIEDYEDVLDLPTAYKIIEICTGVNLADPKLMEAAMTAAESAGTI
jgi:hypothetical protein